MAAWFASLKKNPNVQDYVHSELNLSVSKSAKIYNERKWRPVSSTSADQAAKFFKYSGMARIQGLISLRLEVLENLDLHVF